MGAFNSQFQLNPSAHTLAERLAEHGYATAAVVSNPVLSRGLGLDQGFEHYDDQIPGQGVVQAKSRTARHAVDLALAWLDQRDARPFFLWLHFNDPHGPYDSNHKWTCPLPVTEEGSEQLALGNDHSGYRAIPLHQVFGQQRRVADYRRRYDCAVVGGSIIFVFSQGFFSTAQISGTPQIELVKIFGYDLRDVTPLKTHDATPSSSRPLIRPTMPGKSSHDRTRTASPPKTSMAVSSHGIAVIMLCVSSIQTANQSRMKMAIAPTTLIQT